MGKETTGNAGEVNVVGQKVVDSGKGAKEGGDTGQMQAERSKATGSASLPKIEYPDQNTPCGQQVKG